MPSSSSNNPPQGLDQTQSQGPSSSPTRSIKIDVAQPRPHHAGSYERDRHTGLPISSPTEYTHGVPHPRRSPTLVRSADPNDPIAQERQRSLDVDSANAMQLSRARSGSVAIPFISSGLGSPTQPINISAPRPSSPKGDGSMGGSMDMDLALGTSPHFPFLPPGPGDEEFMEGEHQQMNEEGRDNDLDRNIDLSMSINAASGIPMPMAHHHLSPGHDPSLLVSANGEPHASVMGAGPPLYQASAPGEVGDRASGQFDFGLMESFAAEEKKRLGISSPPRTPAILFSSQGTSASVTPPVGSVPTDQPIGSGSNNAPALVAQLDPQSSTSANLNNEGTSLGNETIPDSSSARLRQRKLSLSTTKRPRARRQGGKMALFEGSAGAPPPSLGYPSGSNAARMPSFEQRPGSSGEAGPSVPFRMPLPPPLYSHSGHDRPYRFSFYSNALSATIHARSLSELPAEGQSFEDLFSGKFCHADVNKAGTSPFMPMSMPMPKSGLSSQMMVNGKNQSSNNLLNGLQDDPCAWWLDVMSPTDEEMKLLSKVFSIHPLTTEDIQMEETREKIELFRNYYLVCFRSFDQDPYSPTYLEPLNMYIIVFREGILSVCLISLYLFFFFCFSDFGFLKFFFFFFRLQFHFRPTPHPQNVRRRIKQLKDYIHVSPDWISYALIDDITDAFGPLIQNIEYEVDSIDELVLILKEAEQSDMLRRYVCSLRIIIIIVFVWT